MIDIQYTSYPGRRKPHRLEGEGDRVHHSRLI